jgi:predicted Zn-dependent protease
MQGQVTEALARAYVNLGVIETQGRRFDRAALRFEAAAGLDPEFPQVQYFLGVALYNAGQYAGAAESLERGLASRPGDADLRRMLAMAWLNTGAYAKAASLLRDDPQREANPSLQLGYLVALVRSGDAAGAVAALEAAARRESQSAEIHSLLAEAYRALGRMEEARQQLEIVRRLNDARRPGPP